MTSSVTLEEAQRLIGTLPTLSPRPNATNIRNLEVALFDALEGIPSHQSPEYGYKGMAQQALEYALDVAVPWTDVANPGPHRIADGTLDVQQQRDADAIFEAHTAVWKSQDNVQRASISALNLAVPKKYKRTNGIGTSNYKTNQSVRNILAGLRDLYGVPTPDEKTNNERRFSAGWQPGEPIEELIDRLEDCYVKSIVMKPPFTMEQMLDKAKSAVQRTGLYATAMLEWDAILEANATWPEFKIHFAEAYDSRIRTGTGTTSDGGYHGAFNTGEEYPNNDSLASIQASMQQSMTQMHLSNNASTQATNDSVAALTAETRQLSAALRETQQQLAMMTQAHPAANGWPTIPAPPIPAYIPAVAPPAYGAPPPTHDGGGGRGRRRNTRRERGGGRGGRGGAAPPAIGVPPTTVSGIPPPAGGGRATTPNPNKWFNNWNYCYTCGYDVAAWHNSQTCPQSYRKKGHQEGCTKELCGAYLAAGHRPSKSGQHKNVLPTNPTENQA